MYIFRRNFSETTSLSTLIRTIGFRGTPFAYIFTYRENKRALRVCEAFSDPGLLRESETAVTMLLHGAQRVCN